MLYFRELDNNSITLIAVTDFQGFFNLTNLYVHVHSRETGIVTVAIGVWLITLFLPLKQEALTQTVHYPNCKVIQSMHVLLLFY